MNDNFNKLKPRIGLYFGILIDQTCAVNKIEAIDISREIEKITHIQPSQVYAKWKVEYDHSGCNPNIIVYHDDYTDIEYSQSMVGSWCLSVKNCDVPDDIINFANEIYDILHTYVETVISGDDDVITLAFGRFTAYFVG